jgi:hypothetical protein
MPRVRKQLLKLKGLVFTGPVQLFRECLKVPLMVDRDALRPLASKRRALPELKWPGWSEGLMSPYYWYVNIRPGERVG